MKQKKLIVIFEIILVLILIYCFIYPCKSNIMKCLGGNSIYFVRTIFHFDLSLLVVTPFLFFVRDEVFKKWLWFALVWFGISTFFIALAPAYNHGLFSMMNPTKESVSLWMSVFFAPLSLGLMLWNSKRLKA